MNYPNLLTPPSNEDSPVSLYLMSSPSSTYTHSESSTSPIHYQTQVSFTPNLGTNELNNAPYLKIIEQPLDKFRFRYKSEMTGTHGSLNGETSDKTRRQTFPTVQLFNYHEAAVVRCSIYQINSMDKDLMPHAHRLVKKNGKDECDDPHDMTVSKDGDFQATFHSMGIIHTAKKNIIGELIKKKTHLKKEEISRLEGHYRSLNKKEEMEIKGLAEQESKSINLNVVCLRFDAFAVDNNGIYFPICNPVYSHGINNLKSALTGELKIVRMDHCTSPATGNREIFLLVERVTKKNIKVRFFEVDDEDNEIWQDFGKFSDLDVHHQYAIVLKTPPYRNKDIVQQVKVFMELVRPTDNATSEPKEFTFTPNPNNYKAGAKRSRPSYDSGDYDTSTEGTEAILPASLNELSISTSGLSADLRVNSAELEKALGNMNSAEFEKIFSQYEYQFSEGCKGDMVNQIGSFQHMLPPVSCDVDAPVKLEPQDDCIGHLVPNTKPTIFWGRKAVIRQHIDDMDLVKLNRVFQELTAFFKTNPSMKRIVQVTRHYLETKNETNGFHIAILQNNEKMIRFFQRLIHRTSQFDLVNVQSEKSGTALHLATLCNNLDVVDFLVTKCNADVSLTDSNHNTPLHLAANDCISFNLLESLFQSKQEFSRFIDLQNNEGDTALHIAIKHQNIQAFKLLCLKKADINKRDNRNGYTPLRFAIEIPCLKILRYILFQTDVIPDIRDFNDVSPLEFVMRNQSTSEVKEIVTKYMMENNILLSEIDIKPEIEDDESDEEMTICDEGVKLEPLTPEELLALYKNITNFTPECLDEVSIQLDRSGTWQNLADLLDLGHLLRCGTFDSRKSPSRQLLTYAVMSNGDNIREIRDFLENLDELKAVQAIDRMVQLQGTH